MVFGDGPCGPKCFLLGEEQGQTVRSVLDENGIEEERVIEAIWALYLSCNAQIWAAGGMFFLDIFFPGA